MVRRPWLRSTLLLAGFPPPSKSSAGGAWLPAPFATAGESSSCSARRLGVVDADEEVAAADRGESFVAVAGSRRTLDGPMRGQW